MENKDILNIKELSLYLNCSISKIRKMIHNNEIPFFCVGNHYRFDSAIIRKWIINRHNDIELENQQYANKINLKVMEDNI